MCYLGSAVYASSYKVGTTGAVILKIPAGARPAGLGGAFAGLGDDVNAISYNTAGLANLKGNEFTFLHTQWFQDTSYEYGAFAWPRAWGTLGFSITTLTSNNIEKRSQDTITPDSMFDSNDAVYKIGYARKFGTIAAGLNMGLINQKIDSEKASTITGDMGLLWNLPGRPLRFGLCAYNIGGKIKFRKDSDPLPLKITFGTSYTFMKILNIDVDLVQHKDTGLKFAAGTEYKHSFSQSLTSFLRAGYNSSATGPDGLTGISAGGGVTYRRVSFDFAWTPYGTLGNTFRYALHIKF